MDDSLVSLLKIRKGNTKRLKNEDELMIENFIGNKVKTNNFLKNIFHILMVHSRDEKLRFLRKPINKLTMITFSKCRLILGLGPKKVKTN